MAKSPEEMAATMIRNLEEKTGRTLEAWIPLVRNQQLTQHGKIVKWLKNEHGMGHGYANLVAHKTLAELAPAVEADPIEAQYAGRKTALRPIYDALVQAVEGFGKDVEIAPKKGYVSLRRSKQFALIEPSTARRVDVGIQLRGIAPGERLEASGSFNAMVSHRVRVSSPDEVDGELIRWLRQAYEQA